MYSLKEYLKKYFYVYIIYIPTLYIIEIFNGKNIVINVIYADFINLALLIYATIKANKIKVNFKYIIFINFIYFVLIYLFSEFLKIIQSGITV